MRSQPRIRATALFGALMAGGLALSAGCRHKSYESEPAPVETASGHTVSTVRVIHPELRKIAYSVVQPGFVEAFEQTAIYSKVSGFIQHYGVDIGDQVKKGDLLVEVFVPELLEEHRQKLAQIELDKRGVEQAERLVEVAQSNIQTATAELAEAKANVGKYEADLAKAKVDVEFAKSKVKVSEAEERRVAALVGYTKITSPYDGMVTVRNANTGDYVQAASGDKENSKGVPIFVVARTDVVRVFVDVPEAYARYVHVGTKASVRAEALHGLAIPATVTRTSWDLNVRTRALRTEIDLPVKNYEGLRPGMYVYGRVIIEKPNVLALPEQAITVLGNQSCCYLLTDGKAVKTPVQRGLSDGTWVEVVQRQTGGSWTPFTGNEQVIVGDLTEIVDGQPVEVARDKAAESAGNGRIGQHSWSLATGFGLNHVEGGVMNCVALGLNWNLKTNMSVMFDRVDDNRDDLPPGTIPGYASGFGAGVQFQF